MAQADSEPAGNERPAVRTTIVGGRPPGCGKDLGDIPRGLEVLLKKAAVDGAFRRLLLSRRAGAADEIDLSLTACEAGMLAVMPRAQLEAIIARTRVEPSRRGAFLGKAAGVMLAALGAAGAGGQQGSSLAAGPPASQPAQVQPAPLEVAGLTAVPADPQRVSEAVSRGVRPDLLQTQPAPASQPASMSASNPTMDPQRVKELIRQLDDKDFKKRQSAQRELEKLLPAVAPLLAEALKDKDITPEQSARLKEALATTQPATPTPPPRPQIRVSAGIMPLD